MENNLQLIKEAVWKANPSIKSLPRTLEDTDARKMIDKMYSLMTIRHFSDDLQSMAKLSIQNYEQERIGTYIRELEGKYVSRSIHLADVLLALNKNSVRIDSTLSRGSDGMCLAMESSNGWGLYNLKDDILDHQSPECIEFLAKLLK